ncbi:MAG TPA: phage tail protein [Blastocatellia bacterium]
MPGQGTSEARYIIEMDTVPVIAATEVSGLDMKHTPAKFFPSNQPFPNLPRGNTECDEVKVKHAHALNSAASNVWSWFQAFVLGYGVQRITFRFIVLDEDGLTPIATYTCTNCDPTSFGADSHNAGGNNASFFNFSIKPQLISYSGM